jgi:hypothetical protein
VSLEPVSLRMQGRHGWLRPGSYLVAVRAFWSLLQNLDVALSGEEKGSVDWEISACKRSGPAEVVFLGHLRKPPKDLVSEIRRTLLNGLRKLAESEERPRGFTDAALAELRALAEQRAWMDEIAVIGGEAEELVQWSFIERIERMTHNDYEALSSVVGVLESISIGKNGRFVVRSEVTSRPVMCRYKRDQFTEQAKQNLGKRVVVAGNLKSNYLGDPIVMRVSGIETCPGEQDLPNIPRMSGRLPVAAAKPANRNYLTGVRYGK